MSNDKAEKDLLLDRGSQLRVCCLSVSFKVAPVYPSSCNLDSVCNIAEDK